MFEWPLPSLAMLVHLLAKSKITRFLHCCWIIVCALLWLTIRILYSMCIIWHQRELCCCFTPYLWFLRIMLNCCTKKCSVLRLITLSLCALCVCLTICLSVCSWTQKPVTSWMSFRSSWTMCWMSWVSHLETGTHTHTHNAVPRFTHVHSPHTLQLTHS